MYGGRQVSSNRNISESSKGKSMRILIVEDDFLSRQVLYRYLQPFGECCVASNGEEALLAMEESLENCAPYDLICLDIMMPGMGGQETLKSLRKTERDHSDYMEMTTKVVMTTSLQDSKNIRQAFSSSADGYLIKPIDKKKLIATIADLGLVTPVPK